jgi:hypothetical protein
MTRCRLLRARVHGRLRADIGRLGLRGAIALEANGQKVQSSLTACQSCLRQFPSPHPVECEPLVTGCRSVMSLGSLLG